MSADGSAARGSLTARVLTAWADMGGSMRWLKSLNPSESTILVIFMLSGGFQFLGGLAKLWLAPETAEMDEGELLSRVGAGFAAALIFRTLFLYILAMIGHGLARAFGGTGSGRDSRAAMAWASLVAAPVTLVLTLAGTLLEPAIGSQASIVLFQIGPLLLAFALSYCMSEVHGFTRPWAVLAVIAVLVFALFAGIEALTVAIRP